MGIGQPRESAALHPNRQVDSFNMARANFRRIGLAESNVLFRAYYLGRRIPRFRLA